MTFLHTASKLPSVTRSVFTQTTSLTFPAGGLEDQTPIINLAMTSLSAAERIDRYIDLGVTDAVKDLDEITTSTMIPLYIDPAYIEGFDPARLGVLPPKCVLIRCLVGSGFLYINLPYGLGGPDMDKVAPFPLHAGKGLFSYAFPRDTVHTAAAAPDPAVPTAMGTFPLALVSLHLRTFEAANRFQLIILK
jgi:hypothetical protein